MNIQVYFCNFKVRLTNRRLLLEFDIKGINHYKTRCNFFFEFIKVLFHVLGSFIDKIKKGSFINSFSTVCFLGCCILKCSSCSWQVVILVFIYIFLRFLIIFGQFKIEISWLGIFFKSKHHMNGSKNTYYHKETHQVSNNNYHNHPTQWGFPVWFRLFSYCLFSFKFCHVNIVHLCLRIPGWIYIKRQGLFMSQVWF